MANSKWTAIPALRSNSIGLQKRFYIVLSFLAVIAITGPLALLVALSSKAPVDATPKEAGIGEYVAVAKVAAQDWLSGKKTSVPLSPGISESFNQLSYPMEPMPYTSLEYEKSVPSYDSGHTYYLNYFLLVSKGKSYKLVITTETEKNITTIVAAPSLDQIYYTNSVSGDYDYLNHSNAAEGIIDSAVETSVDNWATAFVSNDSEKLKTIVNDNNDYRGLEGFTLVGSPTIVSSLPDSTNSLYVRVKLVISPDSAKQLKLSVDYDLLVTTKGKQIPNVVAWGPAGSAPLTPYQNRITN